MFSKNLIIAEQFVDFVFKILRHDLLDKIEKFNEEDAKILFAIVKVAGFEPKELVFETLLGKYRDQDGSFTGETYPINKVCPFKVVNQEGKDDYFATGWLDCVFRRVITGSKKKEKKEDIVSVIKAEIQRSIPLVPIQFTSEEDMLCEHPPSPNFSGLEYFIDHTKDDNKLQECVGIHKYCRGYIDRIKVTESRDVLICRRCHLRVSFPKGIETYGDLRKFFAKNLKSAFKKEGPYA